MDDKLNDVNQVLAAKVRQILLAMTALGYPMRVIQGLRTDIYQHELWLQGRDVHGNIVDAKKIVTNCDGFKILSPHQSGKAVDCAFLDAQGKITFDDHLPWSLYGQMAVTLGLTWGGGFRMKDLDHVQIS